MNEYVEGVLRASLADAESSLASLAAQKAKLEADLALVNVTMLQAEAKCNSLKSVLPETEEP